MIFLVVMVFNVRTISNASSIDLIQAERKNKQVKTRRLWVCVILFSFPRGVLGNGLCHDYQKRPANAGRELPPSASSWALWGRFCSSCPFGISAARREEQQALSEKSEYVCIAADQQQGKHGLPIDLYRLRAAVFSPLPSHPLPSALIPR